MRGIWFTDFEGSYTNTDDVECSHGSNSAVVPENL